MPGKTHLIGLLVLALAAPVMAQTSLVKVVDLVQLSEVRVSRTVYQYQYALGVRNAGVDLTDVKVQLTAVGGGTTVVDGQTTVGKLAEGETGWPNDTITVRHDRTVPFNRDALIWVVTGIEAIPMEARLLPGVTTESALIRVGDFRAKRSAEDMKLAFDTRDDVTYYTRHLEASISRDATVGMVNAALTSVGGRIGFSSRYQPVVTIQFRQDKNADELRHIADLLKQSGAFEAADLSIQFVPDELPSNLLVPGTSNLQDQGAVINSGGPVHHHAAVRLPAAWNARRAALGQSDTAPVQDVEVIIADYFGRGRDAVEMVNVVGTGIAANAKCAILSRGLLIDPCPHGYHVFGILAGSFLGERTESGQVTGAIPLPVRVHVIDMASLPSGITYMEMIRVRLEEIFRDIPPSRKFVFSLSLGGTGNLDSALKWQRMVRGLTIPVTGGPPSFDYESRVIQVSSAGNGGPSAIASANSAWNASVMLGDAKLSPLTNGLVVEDRQTQFAQGRVRVGDLSLTSTIRGNIGAVGTNVYSFLGPQNGRMSAGKLSGTSMSTPQVSGAAAFLLAMGPGANVASIVSTLKLGGQSTVAGVGTPVLDAYVSALRLDKQLASAPVRQAILNVGTRRQLSEGFGFKDAEVILSALTRPPAGQAGQKLDFSRFDLNGDGFTGGDGRVAFDLDLSGEADRPVFTPERTNSLSKNSAMVVDERQASDLDVLCFYVNSALFESSVGSARRTELQNRFRGRVLDKSGLIKREIDCGAIDLDESYEIESVITHLNPRPETIVRKGAARCPDGRGGVTPCDASIWCSAGELGDRDIALAKIRLQSHLRKVRVTDDVDTSEGEFIAFTSDAIGKIKINWSYPRKPTLLSAGVQFYTEGKGKLDAKLNPLTGWIEGKFTEESTTTWSIGAERQTCVSESSVRARPLTPW